jgi:serine/threonine-protein kinase
MDQPPSQVPGYVLLFELGRGTTGVVYKARHHKMQRAVALKIPLPIKGAEQFARNDQFLNECRAVAYFQHPSIVRLCEVSMTDDGRPYQVREFVDGDALKALALAKAIHLRDGLRALGQIAEAIHHVHEAGFAHRNLRASNILVARDGRAVLIGFGWVGFLPGSPHLLPGMPGTPAEVDVRGLQDLAKWLASVLEQPLPPELARLCEPGAAESPRAFAETVACFT